MDVRVETTTPVRVAYLRGTGPFQQMFPPLWKRLRAHADRRGLVKPGVVFLSIPWGNPRTTPPAQLRGDACVAVDEAFVPDQDLQVQAVPAGLYAIYRYVGPYSGLPQAWGRLLGWIPDNGYRLRPDAVCYEVYRNDPAVTPAAEVVTEIHQPVEPAR